MQEGGDPPEVTHFLLPEAAMPVGGMRQDLEGAKSSIKEQRPLDVVLEGSGNDTADVNLRRVHALNSVTTELGSSVGTEYHAPKRGRIDNSLLLSSRTRWRAARRIARRWISFRITKLPRSGARPPGAADQLHRKTSPAGVS